MKIKTRLLYLFLVPALLSFFLPFATSYVSFQSLNIFSAGGVSPTFLLAYGGLGFLMFHCLYLAVMAENPHSQIFANLVAALILADYLRGSFEGLLLSPGYGFRLLMVSVYHLLGFYLLSLVRLRFGRLRESLQG